MNLACVIPSKTTSNLLPCMEAIRKHEPGIPIVCVDDGLDLSFLPRPDFDPPVQFIRGEKPFIFSRNINAGVRRAIELDPGVEGFVLANDDALLQTPGGFSVMAQACKAYPEFGLIGATCNNVGNPNQHRREIGLRIEPRMVCFVCVYIPRSTFDAVGLLDERYTKYGCDDDDFSFEVRKAGLKIGVHDGCYVDHGSLTSSFRGAAGAGGDFRPNLKVFIEKWGHDNWNQGRATSQFAELFP